MHNVELFNYKQAPKHWDSYFEMSMRYYFQLLIQTDKGEKICFLQPSISYYNINTIK